MWIGCHFISQATRSRASCKSWPLQPAVQWTQRACHHLLQHLAQHLWLLHIAPLTRYTGVLQMSLHQIPVLSPHGNCLASAMQARQPLDTCNACLQGAGCVRCRRGRDDSSGHDKLHDVCACDCGSEIHQEAAIVFCCRLPPAHQMPPQHMCAVMRIAVRIWCLQRHSSA